MKRLAEYRGLPLPALLADIDFIALRVLELVCTANDLRPFAEDMGYHGKPFRWDEVRRAQLRAELDATYARLYSRTRDELRYTLRVDPKEVHGEDSSTLPTVAGRISLAKPSACGKRKDQALVGVPGLSFTMKRLALLTAIP